MENLVGTPVDPRFEYEWSRVVRQLDVVDETANERYWASYVGGGYVWCNVIEAAIELFIESNATRTEAKSAWVELIDLQVTAMDDYPGLQNTSLEHRVAIMVAGQLQHCSAEYTLLDDFING